MLSFIVSVSSISQDIDNNGNKYRISVVDQKIKGSDNKNETVPVAVYKDTVITISPECRNYIISPKAHSIGFVEYIDGMLVLKVYDTLGRLVISHSNLPSFFTSNMQLFESGYFTYFGRKHEILRSFNDSILLFVYNNKGELVFQNEPWGMRSINWYQIPQANITVFSGPIIGTDPIQYQLVILQDSEDDTKVLSKILDAYPDSEIWCRSIVNPDLKLISVYYYYDPDHNIDSSFFKYSSSCIYSIIEKRE